MPDEPKYYNHGCGSAADCNLEAVKQGYDALRKGLSHTAEGARQRSMAEFATMRGDVETPRADSPKGDYGQ